MPITICDHAHVKSLETSDKLADLEALDCCCEPAFS